MIDALTERVEAIFYDVLAVEPSSRKAYLDQVCAGDAGLRARVEEMLSSQSQAEGFFKDENPGAGIARLVADASVGKEAGLNLEVPAEQELGKQIGPYKLLQKIGEGGCGLVYMAEQEKPVRRRVALKVIKLGMDTKNVIARFAAERQALALMDHPNIASVLDAGATELGRPFFVMELVRGVKITEFCDQNHLDVRQRLEVFIHVCSAIQHAHQKGVIHRDIKPSNVLVTSHDGVPVPKVIDFGIAKATEGRLADNTLFTAYDQFIGTPAYMSPEQAEMSGLDVDTRSDIYSLGVLLYELLTGKTPFESKELLASGLDALRHTLREKEPQMPSTLLTSLRQDESSTTAKCRRTDSRKLISVLQGDLDWIVMKALEKDRTRRYQTANGLALDIQRYLDNEPIFARPPSRLYRLQKLVRRNKIVFAAIGVTSAALIFGLGTSMWMMIKEREARQRAVAAEQAEFRLRQEAENREKITQAAFLISQEKMAEADRMVDKVSNLQPSLEAEDVLRTLGEWHALQGHWKLAAARFIALLQADQSDKSEMITSDLLLAGPVLIESGDVRGYEHFRQKAIARFAGTTNPVNAERTVKISLLIPADPQTMKLLEPFAELAAKSFERDGINAGSSPLMASWRCVSLSLMAYRQGYTPTAKEWGRRSLSYPINTPARIATVHVIRAMACQQLGEVEQAHSELEQGRKMIEDQFARGLKKGNGPEGWWADWHFARILLREAEALIEPSPKNSNGGGGGN